MKKFTVLICLVLSFSALAQEEIKKRNAIMLGSQLNMHYVETSVALNLGWQQYSNKKFSLTPFVKSGLGYFYAYSDHIDPDYVWSDPSTYQFASETGLNLMLNERLYSVGLQPHFFLRTNLKSGGYGNQAGFGMNLKAETAPIFKRLIISWSFIGVQYDLHYNESSVLNYAGIGYVF